MQRHANGIAWCKRCRTSARPFGAAHTDRNQRSAAGTLQGALKRFQLVRIAFGNLLDQLAKAGSGMELGMGSPNTEQPLRVLDFGPDLPKLSFVGGRLLLHCASTREEWLTVARAGRRATNRPPTPKGEATSRVNSVETLLKRTTAAARREG